MNSKDFAMFYATEKGWAVFPLKPHDKKPLFPAAHEKGNPCHGECGKVGHGFHDATKDADVISEWWNANPTAGVGIATGDISGFFALDVDPIHNGEDTYKAHIEKYGQAPKTVTALTGSGGHHYLYKMPQLDVRNSAGKLGAGLDTRGNGGYIATAPTIHPNGTPYKWVEPPSKTILAESPEWILRMLFEQKTHQAQHVSTGAADGAYISGQRNNALTSLAGAMRRRNMSEDAIFVALNAENINRCIPPLPESEVRAIAASVTRYTAQDAMPLTNKDRAQAEWSFVRCVYEWPRSAMEFQDIAAGDFGQKELADFWQSVNAGIDPTDAAVNSGILSEIEKYTDYIHGHMEGYARQIKQFSYQARIVKVAETLKHQALNGNNAGIEKALNDMNKIPSQSETRIISIGDTADEVEGKIRERAENPTDVWGIPYAWEHISKMTGGKQKGELILDAAEPGIGKSWWWLQDALETAILERPVLYWCGEMRRYQIMMRLYQLLGVNGHNMKTGRMTVEDWGLLDDAKALIMNSPLFLDDRPLHLNEVRPMLIKEIAEHGVEQVIFDYDTLMDAPGKDDIEQSANTSRTLKNLSQDLNISVVLISSVNKGGMDVGAEFASKSNVRGSGQKLHDADIVYIKTKFDDKKGIEYGIKMEDYDKTIMHKIKKGRELVGIENGFIVYQREPNSPRFKEILKPAPYNKRLNP